MKISNNPISRIITKSIFLFPFATLVFSSCKVNNLIDKNNKITEESLSNLQTLNSRTVLIENQIKTNTDTLLYKLNSPNLTGLTQVNYKDFYSGIIVKESVSDINLFWKKINLTESIPSGGNSLTFDKIGYLNTQTPDVIYMSEKKIVIPYVDYLNDKTITEPITKDKKTIDSIVGIKSNTARIDSYSQKEVDIMIANNEYCFDGFKFDNKRFDYLDLTKGSFRGTKFNNCALDFAVSKRNSFNNNSFDFDNTAILNSVQTNWKLDFWRIFNSYFMDTRINNSFFNNCNFEKSNFNKTIFSNCNFKNQNEITFNEILGQQLNFTGCYFDSIKIFSSNIWAGSIVNSNFHNSQIKWTNFSSYGTTPTKIETSGFYNCEFISGSFEEVIIDHPASFTIFDNVKFINPLWRLCKVKAWFRGNCSFMGYGSNMNGTNWLSSIFDNTTFNAPNAPKLLPLQNCNFSLVDFRENVVFHKCDFKGSTFPPIPDLQAAGVKFYNCQHAPYNN